MHSLVYSMLLTDMLYSCLQDLSGYLFLYCVLLLRSDDET